MNRHLLNISQSKASKALELRVGMGAKPFILPQLQDIDILIDAFYCKSRYN